MVKLLYFSDVFGVRPGALAKILTTGCDRFYRVEVRCFSEGMDAIVHQRATVVLFKCLMWHGEVGLELTLLAVSYIVFVNFYEVVTVRALLFVIEAERMTNFMHH